MISREKHFNFRRRPFFWTSPNFGEKTLQFSAKIFFLFGRHSISATELRNLYQSTFAYQMHLVKAAKASPHANFYNLSAGHTHTHMEKVFTLFNSSIIFISLRVGVGPISDFFNQYRYFSALKSFSTQDHYILYIAAKRQTVALFDSQ